MEGAGAKSLGGKPQLSASSLDISRAGSAVQQRIFQSDQQRRKEETNFKFLVGTLLVGLLVVVCGVFLLLYRVEFWGRKVEGNLSPTEGIPTERPRRKREMKGGEEPSPLPEKKAAFDCFLKEDKLYPDPEVKCTCRFWSCSGGSASEMHCPPSLRFDPISQACLFREFVEVCGGRATTTTTDATTTVTEEGEGEADAKGQEEAEKEEEKVTEPAIPPPDCDALKDGLHPDPNAVCSQFFFACVGRTSILQKCPPHLRFDAPSSRCLAPTHVGACGGSTTSLPDDQTTASTTLRALPGGKTEPDFPCGDETGNFADPLVACSPFFYSCIGARFGTLRKCPGDTFFDPLFRTCDFFDSVTECSGKRRTTQEPRQQEDGTTAFVPKSKRTHNGNEFDCSSKLPGNYPEPDIACVNHFFVCDAALQVKKVKCPRLTFYDTELNQCLLWKDVPDCSGNPRTSPATLKPITTPKPPFDCSRLDDGNYPVPKLGCPRFFYQCAHGNAHRTPCPGDLRYHFEWDQCVNALEVPSCTGGRKN